MREFLFGPGPIVFVQELFGPDWLPVMELLSLLGTNWGIIAVLGLGFWLWGRETGYALAAALVLEGVVNLALNQLFHVQRPDASGIVVYEEVPLGSFPSGHTFNAVVVWGMLYALGRIPLWAAAVPVAGVALGRVFLGTHFLGDVVGGVAFGVLLILVFRPLWPRLKEWAAERSFRTFAALGAVAVLAALATTRVIGRNVYEWGAVGIGIGLAAGFLLEYRFLGYSPEPASAGRRGARVLLGTAGVAAALLLVRQAEAHRYVLTAVAAGAATLWAVLLAPALFVAVGIAERRE